MDTNLPRANVTTVFDMPTKWDNNGRELRILEGLAALTLTRPVWGFSRGLDRARRWRIIDVAAEDMEAVLAYVRASGAADAKVYGSTVEWLNLGC